MEQIQEWCIVTFNKGKHYVYKYTATEQQVRWKYAEKQYPGRPHTSVGDIRRRLKMTEKAYYNLIIKNFGENYTNSEDRFNSFKLYKDERIKAYFELGSEELLNDYEKLGITIYKEWENMNIKEKQKYFERTNKTNKYTYGGYCLWSDFWETKYKTLNIDRNQYTVLESIIMSDSSDCESLSEYLNINIILTDSEDEKNK